MEISKQKKKIITLVFKMLLVVYLLQAFYKGGEVVGELIYHIGH